MTFDRDMRIFGYAPVIKIGSNTMIIHGEKMTRMIISTSICDARAEMKVDKKLSAVVS